MLVHTFASIIIQADASCKASLLITDSIAGFEVALLTRCWSRTITLYEGFLHSEASRAILAMAASVVTDSANRAVVLTFSETGFEVAAIGGRG